MSKQHAAYFGIPLIPLLCAPPPSACNAFHLLWGSTMLLVAGFSRCSRDEMMRCFNVKLGICFPRWFFTRHSQVGTQTLHHLLGAALQFFFYMFRKPSLSPLAEKRFFFVLKLNCVLYSVLYNICNYRVITVFLITDYYF